MNEKIKNSIELYLPYLFVGIRWIHIHAAENIALDKVFIILADGCLEMRRLILALIFFVKTIVIKLIIIVPAVVDNSLQQANSSQADIFWR